MRAVASCLAALLLTACGHDVQTTSGQAYLAQRPDWRTVQPMSAPALAPVDQAVRQAASAEPLLRFPARIGLARLQFGRLTPVPSEEADAWIDLAAKLGPSFGEFVAINPLVAQLTASAAGDQAARSAVDVIRIGAARQHVDAVLIYETAGSSRGSATPFSVLDLTILGAFLVPSRTATGDARAYAMLVDVRNGYPYGQASAQGDDRSLTTLAASNQAERRTMDAARVIAVRNLTVEVDAMMRRLATELAALPPPASRRVRTR